MEALLIHAVYLINAALRGPRHPREVAARRSSTPCGWAPRLGAVGVVLHPGSAQKGDVGRGDHRAGALIRRRSPSPRAASCTSRTPRARAGRSGAPSGARRAARRGRRRQAPRRLPGLLPPVRVRLRHPHRRGRWRGRSTSSTPRSACDRLRLAARQRLADRAGLEPRPPRGPRARASSATTAAPRSCPSRASTACPASSRAPDPELQGATEMERCAALRERGAAARRRGEAPARPASGTSPCRCRCRSRRTSAGSATRSFRPAG